MRVSADPGLERLERAFSRLLRHGTVQSLHDRLLRRVGIECERAAYLVLRRIVLAGPLRVTDLAQDLGVEPSTVSRHIQPVEARGWVERLADPGDARASLIAATPAGKETVDRVEAERRQFFAAVLADWSDQDRQTLFDLIERFAADLHEHAAKDQR